MMYGLMETNATQTSSALASGVVALLAALSQNPAMASQDFIAPLVEINRIDVTHIGRHESSASASVAIAEVGDMDQGLQHDLHSVFQALALAQSDIEPEFQEVVYSNRSELYTLF